jgi:benzoate-CoA ligase
MRVGLVPIPLNTLMPASDFAYVLGDSGARAVLVSEPLAATVAQAIGEAGWPGRMFVARPDAGLAELVGLAASEAAPHDSHAEDIAFWIYSSGSTGRPKGAQHRHRSLPATAELFSRQVLGVAEEPPPSCSAARCWASPRTMSSTPPASCSSPMAWAIR